MKIPSYAKASEGYPPVAKSAEAMQHIDIDDLDTTYAFIHGQARGLLPRRIKKSDPFNSFYNKLKFLAIKIHNNKVHAAYTKIENRFGNVNILDILEFSLFPWANWILHQ
jgi:hypothetical protein